MIKILLAEDDGELCSLVKAYLNASGYEATACRDGQEALERFLGEKFDMLITDIMMPRKDGFSLARDVRELNKDVPIIFMTARDDKLSKQLGYKTGIDDYVTKPFDNDELLARVAVQLRRGGREEALLVRAGIEMNFETFEVTADGVPLRLTRTEFAILRAFLENPKKVFSRSALVSSIEDYVPDGEESSVGVHISNLRRKLEEASGKNYIDTVWGIGFRLSPRFAES